MRCVAPTSARPGDRATVLGDGTIDGFVGGSCADATVRLQALRVLETGEPVLLRILPGRGGRPERRGRRGRGRQPVPERRRARAVPRAAPAAGARRGGRRVAGRAGAGRAGGAARVRAPGWARVAEPGDFAAVVASLGQGDEEAVRRGLEAGCEYVGLVASRRRGAALLDALRAEGVADDGARAGAHAGRAGHRRAHACGDRPLHPRRARAGAARAGGAGGRRRCRPRRARRSTPCAA